MTRGANAWAAGAAPACPVPHQCAVLADPGLVVGAPSTSASGTSRRHNGGICDNMIVSWPAKIDAHGEIRDQYCHVTDVTPTIYDMLDIEFPEVVKGATQMPLHGVSFAHTFDDADAERSKTVQYYGLLGTRSIRADGWKGTTVHPAVGGWSDFGGDTWELYHVDEDRSEMRDLSDQYPEKLQDLINRWFLPTALALVATRCISRMVN